MTEPLERLSPVALARSVKANLYAQFRYMGTAPVTVFLENEQIVSWQTPFPVPWFNGVLSLRDASGDVESLVAERLAFFAARAIDAVRWWLEDGVDPAGWEPYLLRAGFKPDCSTPGMAIDLQRLPEAGEPPDGLQIVPVRDLQQLRRWVTTILAGFGLGPELEESCFALISGMGLELPIRHYLGVLDGQPVATSTLFLGAGVAGLYNVATRPEARGRGAGSALTLAPMRDALALGYRVGILQASEQGFPVYRRLGFEHVCAMAYYTWRKDAQS